MRTVVQVLFAILKEKKQIKSFMTRLEILVKLEHRGGVSADGKTGDGAGLLIDIPHDYFKRVCGFGVPEQREYAVGMVFLPKVRLTNTSFAKQRLKMKLIANQGLSDFRVA